MYFIVVPADIQAKEITVTCLSHAHNKKGNTKICDYVNKNKYQPNTVITEIWKFTEMRGLTQFHYLILPKEVVKF